MNPSASRRDPGTAAGEADSRPPGRPQPLPEAMRLRVHGGEPQPTLVYLPGLHGDWTLVGGFRAAVKGHFRFVELVYPRSLDWTLAQYAEAVAEALARKGIGHGWLLGESFGSQVAWAMLELQEQATHQPGSAPPFRIQGLILANGFVRHPWPWGVRFAAWFIRSAPLPWLMAYLKFYLWFARFRHRRAPETLAEIQEFAARRTDLDRQAAAHRLDLIITSRFEAVARRTKLPVYYLAGLVDPLVPWPWVRRWLRRHCPGYSGGCIAWRADHNVLGTAPAAAAQRLREWITGAFDGS